MAFTSSNGGAGAQAGGTYIDIFETDAISSHEGIALLAIGLPVRLVNVNILSTQSSALSSANRSKNPRFASTHGSR